MKILNSNLITNISSTIRNHLLTSSKNIKTHPSPNMDVTSHRRLFQKDGIGLSQTGKATQLVIMSHGGWKEISHPQTLFTRQKGDGWTVVPKNLRIDFYTKDNDFTKGLSVLSEVNKRHTEAQKGLTPSLNISKDDLKVLANARNIPQSKLEEEMMSQAIYRKEYATSNEKIKNYALYYHEEPRQPDGCKLKTAPVRPVVAARSAEYVCSEDLFY
ncbi:TPA: putative adhesin [Shigella sonnei]|nr:adhesin [Shigella sonnei]